MSTHAGVGISQNFTHSFEAGKAAARDAQKNAVTETPQLVIVFATEQFDEPALLQGITSVTGATPLVGCTAASVIANDKTYSDAVSVAFIISDTLRVTLALSEHLSSGTKEAGRKLGSTILAAEKEGDGGVGRVALMFVDASKTLGVISEVVAGAYEVLGASFRFVGGGSSDNLHFKKSSQYLNGQVYTDAAIVACISTKTPQAVALKHGWTPTGRDIVVTKAEGKVVKELDGEPALQMYMNLLHQDVAAFDFTQFYPFASGHPLGIPAGAGEFIVRDPLAADLAANAITFVSEVPENSIVRIMEGTKESLLEASRAAALRANEMLEGGKPALIVSADCVSRLLFLGDDVATEVANIQPEGGNVPVIGFFSFGEIGIEKSGPPAFCNKTCALYVIPE
jgi:hypothetical protein